MTNRMGLGLDIESDKQIHSLVSLKVLVKVGDSPVGCEHDWGCGKTDCKLLGIRWPITKNGGADDIGVVEELPEYIAQ